MFRRARKGNAVCLRVPPAQRADCCQKLDGAARWGARRRSRAGRHTAVPVRSGHAKEQDVTVGPLDGVRVVEISSWMAAPSAGAVLADMGADVVKVEPLSGDAVRNMSRKAKNAPDIDHSFHMDNRGKRSIAVAIDRPDGAEIVRKLLDRADVFLCNLLPHRQERFGLDPATVHGRNPRLVHATLSGYGLVGPDVQRPGFDVTTFFGRGAITDAMTEPGGVAPQPRPAQGDHTTGLAMVAAILAALRVAERTGEGPVVDVSLFATAAWTMASDLAPTLVDGAPVRKRDRHHLITPLGNRFRCSDDRWIILNMPETRWWPPFCKTVERPELLEDERFGTVKDRFDNMPALIDILDEVMATRTLAEWGQIFDDAGLIWGPAASIDELANDPQAAAIDLFPTIQHPEGDFRTVAAPMRIAGAEIRPRGPAPALGADTDTILTEIGYTDDETIALSEAGVIGR
jgi:crotonobetainyl-CoA:carnitine CoA-transferase CaiB-like acyl-CoA transferase